MKLLLTGVNSKYIHSNPALYYLREYAVKHFAEEYGAEGLERFSSFIEIAEYTINQERQAVLRDIFQKKPDVIAFSCYIWNITFIEDLLGDIHKVSPTTDIWLGGPEVSFDSEKRLEKYPFVRGIIAGEGEESFYRLTKEYFSTEADACGRRETELGRVLTPDTDLDFDDVPFPYSDISEFENRIIYYEASRGCPFRCAYCLSSVDRKVRLRNIELIRKELQIFLDAKVPQVKFVDRTFNCNKEHTLAILSYIKEHDNGITNFHFEMAAELIDDEEILLLNSLRKGLVQLEIGVQTTNRETLALVNRKSDIGKLRKIVKRLREPRNMHIHLDLIAGLPKEGIESFKQSFDDVYSMQPDNLQLGFLKVLKGSPIESMVSDYGIIYSEHAPYEVLSTSDLSFEDILELKEVEEVLEVYHNSGQFENSLAFLEAHYDSPYRLYAEIAFYYKDHGYFSVNHGRVERYRILRDFFIEKTEYIQSLVRAFEKPQKTVALITSSSETAEFSALLMKDLYLRENIKNRPDFYDDGIVPKDERHEFFESRAYEQYLDKESYAAFSPVQVANMTHLEKTATGYLLFDYQNRDELTHNAGCVEITK